MGFLSWIIVGGLAGWIAGMIMKEEGGIVRNIVLGIVGGLIGGFVFNMLGGVGTTGINIYSIFVATIGAIILIALSRAFKN